MQNKSTKAFSLAELMILMLILTIIMAATMPLLSKRSKMKAASTATAASSWNVTTTCTKTMTATNNTTGVLNYDQVLTSNITMLSYTMTGNGDPSCYYGCPPNTIAIDNVTQATMKVAALPNGTKVSGIFANLAKNQELTISLNGSNLTLNYTTTDSKCSL